MLTEYLQQANAPLCFWFSVMPGARACRFSLDSASPVMLPPKLEHMHFEALFCLRGRLILDRTRDRRLAAAGREILLLSDAETILDARIPGQLDGVLVSVDARQARESLRRLCELMGGLSLDTSQARRFMARHEGCAVLPAAPWSHAVFEELCALPEEEQGRYSVFKTVELLYLLCSGGAGMLRSGPDPAQPGGYLARTVAAVRGYMEEHLEEKLTIPGLCRQFCISQTSLKDYFRRMYGMPVHAWLKEQRMIRAAQLLRTSSMSILQVAQAVGYSGASQFNLAFKRRYGVTPRQYIKLPACEAATEKDTKKAR